jgi:hypothetical protein
MKLSAQGCHGSSYVSLVKSSFNIYNKQITHHKEILSMYRLANIVDSRLQKIITKELMHGFEETCNLKATDAKDIMAQIEFFFDEMDISMDSKMQHDLTVYNAHVR